MSCAAADEVWLMNGELESPSAGGVLTDVRALMVGLTGFCVFLSVYATQTLLPLFADIFHAGKLQTSLTVSATTIAIALAAPAIGLLAERFGRRRVMVGSVALLTAPILLSA